MNQGIPQPFTRVTTPSDREICIERAFEVPREGLWKALTEPDLLARWWGRGHPLLIERFDLQRGGHWRFVEHSPEGIHGFEGRFREVMPPERIVQTFEWDGMPGYVVIETLTLEALRDGRTKLVTLSLFSTKEERDGMLQSGMEVGVKESYAALDKVVANHPDYELSAPEAGLPGQRLGLTGKSRIAPCLWFDTQAEEAANLYVSVFERSSIDSITRFGSEGFEVHGRPEGSVMTVAFRLAGQALTALNGGPQFKFSEAISLQVFCDTQEEVDHFWGKLSEGGEEGPCGWLKDRFGLSWQVVPVELTQMLRDPDAGKSQRTMRAMLQMKKLDISALRQAFDGV